jgi:hypothetical protein
VQLFGQIQQTFTVKASADGSAEFGVTLDSPDGDSMLVTSTSADGWVSQNFYFLDVYGTTKDWIQLADYFYVFFVN